MNIGKIGVLRADILKGGAIAGNAEANFLARIVLIEAVINGCQPASKLPASNALIRIKGSSVIGLIDFLGGL